MCGKAILRDLRVLYALFAQRVGLTAEQLHSLVHGEDDEALRIARAMSRVATSCATTWRVESRAMRPPVRFCASSDGVRLAFAVSGDGPPLVRAPHWFTHLEHDWTNPGMRPWAEDPSKRYRLLRFDQRGTGLSDRKVPEISLEAHVRDLEAVVDAAGFERFALLGLSQGAAIGVVYAVRHPERVSHLILCGGFVRGWADRPAEMVKRFDMDIELIRFGWDRADPSYRQVFSSQFMPDAPMEAIQSFNDHMPSATSAENAAANYAALDAERQGALQARLREVMRPNRYDAATGRLVIAPERARAFEEWTRYYGDIFGRGRSQYAIPPGAVSDPGQQRDMTAFFWWTAWAASTNRPGSNASYTNNWPHEPLVGNEPTGSNIVWSVISFVLLLAGVTMAVKPPRAKAPAVAEAAAGEPAAAVDKAPRGKAKAAPKAAPKAAAKKPAAGKPAAKDASKAASKAAPKAKAGSKSGAKRGAGKAPAKSGGKGTGKKK